MKNKPNTLHAYEKVKKVIEGCITKSHLKTTFNMIVLFNKIYGKSHEVYNNDLLNKYLDQRDKIYNYM